MTMEEFELICMQMITPIERSAQFQLYWKQFKMAKSGGPFDQAKRL